VVPVVVEKAGIAVEIAPEPGVGAEPEPGPELGAGLEHEPGLEAETEAE
jgi:hypothetical protein